MKKLLLLIVILISAIPIFAEYEDRVPGTKTIELETLNDIRDACHPIHGHSGFSPIIRQYYSDYLDAPLDSHDEFHTATYVKESFWGVIGHDMPIDPNTELPIDPDDKLELARRHLLDPSFQPDYLSLEAVDAYMHNPAKKSFRRCLELGYIFEDTAFMVDMLWEYQDGDFQTDLANKLDSLASYVDELIYALGEDGYDPNVSVWIAEPQAGTWDNPGIYFHNGRIRLAGALGYAGCVLLNTSYHTQALGYIDHAKEELFTYQHSQVSITNPGFIGLYLTNSGVYGEGPGYTNYAFDGVSLFFTALKRQTGENLYDHPYMQQIFENSLNYIAPDFKLITQDDTYKQSSYTYELFIRYLYQSDNINNEMIDKMKWYANKYKEESISGSNRYPGSYNRQKYILDFNPDRDVTNYNNVVPASISSGSTSDNELTIIRKEINTTNEYINSPTMVINHENSLALSHEDSDQSSFQLYYKGKQLLIDPGYGPAKGYYIAKQWLKSPYAHNLITANPDKIRETDALNISYYNVLQTPNVASLDSLWTGTSSISHDFYPEKYYEPVGDHGSISNAELLTPCFKNYLINNNSNQHLQVEIAYDHQQNNFEMNQTFPNLNPADTIFIKRNYYSINNNSYFIIYDDVKSALHNESNVFCNQLHFASIPIDDNGFLNDSLDSLGVSLYRYRYRNEPIYLHLAMGSQNLPLSYSRRNNLPSGVYKTSDYQNRQEHRDLRLFTQTSDNEQFLTLLIPSESNNSPINFIENYSNGYGVNYDLDTSDSYETYTAVCSGETYFRFYQNEMQFNTSANFFLFKTNENCSDIKKLILNGDNSFEVHDLACTRFPDVLVFDTDYNPEEVMADWKDNKLHITFKTESNDYPKYKILRSGVLPQNLFSKTEFGSYHPGTEPNNRGTIENNIQKLAYDDKYFYVNYSIADLVSENLLGEDLVVYQGSYSNITVPERLTLGTGELILSVAWDIPQNCKLKILSGAKLKLSENFTLSVSGQLTAIGTEGQRKILFTNLSTRNWEKILITPEGRADLEFCKISNSNFPIYNKGYLTLKHSQITECNRGVILKNPSGYFIENSAISDCGYFGILLQNTLCPVYRSELKDNLITGNNIGIWFYNASAYVESDLISANKYAGIYCLRNSNPIIVGSFISDTYYNSEDNPEIKIAGSSYPVINENRNDIIFANGYSIYNLDNNPRNYYCTENWWGTTDQPSISESFYPNDWVVEFAPFCNEPNVNIQPPQNPITLFRQGVAAEIDGNIDLARNKYLQSIEENLDDNDAILASGRLINCCETQEKLTETKEYYENLLETLPEGNLAKTVNLNKIFTNRRLGNYQEALEDYEALAATEQTVIDSIFTQLDIVYTYLEASSGNGKNVNLQFKCSKNELHSYKEAKEKESKLWELLGKNTERGSIYSPKITKIKLHSNYPNPFNPSTTISFELPKSANVDLSIYNIKGQKIKTLKNEFKLKGKYSFVWNGKNSQNKAVSSGVYFYKLDINGKTVDVKKCILLK